MRTPTYIFTFNSPGVLWAGDDACQTLGWKSGICCEFSFLGVGTRVWTLTDIRRRCTLKLEH